MEYKVRMRPSAVVNKNRWISIDYNSLLWTKSAQKTAKFSQDSKKPAISDRFSMSFDNVLVPRKGLEPSRLAALPPEGSASTNSATWAGAAPLLAASHGDVNGA
jgi:hypothetical protein